MAFSRLAKARVGTPRNTMRPPDGRPHGVAGLYEQGSWLAAPVWRMSFRTTKKACFVLSFTMLAALSTSGCATRKAATPQPSASTALTGAKIGPRIERVLVVDNGIVAMVARDGCVATISTAELEAGSSDELRVRCPRPDRMRAWFEGVDRLTAAVPLEPTKAETDTEDLPLPSAELVTASGKAMHVVQKNDAKRLLAEVRALTAELASAEVPAPGPSTPGGWQMLRVSGPAHVFFAGAPTRGVLDARVSTTGQYFCEFLANTDDGPMRATKSGWIAQATASKAIDEVLQPFVGLGDAERPKATFASGTTQSGERKASASATAAVFARFAPVQDALGDACVPELEAPGVTMASPQEL